MTRITRTIKATCRPLGNERGQSMAVVGIGLGTTAFLALAVVAVDVGHMAFTATEVQTLADATAVAAARALLDGADTNAIANTVAAGNTVDGTSAIVPCSGGSPCANLALGTIDSSTWAFTAGGAPPNAVKSTAQATVNNILATMLGSPTSTVTKTAVGAFVGLGSGGPNLPIALCDCAFPADCFSQDCQPAWTHPTWTDTAGWTGFDAGHSTSDINHFIPSACPQGDGATPPNLTANTSTTDATNGTGPFEGVRCMVCELNMCTEASPCLAPVIDCGACPSAPINGQMTVVGFANVAITNFHCTAGGGMDCPCGTPPPIGNVDGIEFHSVYRTDVTGPPGGGNFGTLVVGMVG